MLEVILDPRYASGIDVIEYDARQFEVKMQPSNISANRFRVQIKPLATANPLQSSITVHSLAKNGYASERAIFHAFVRP